MSPELRSWLRKRLALLLLLLPPVCALPPLIAVAPAGPVRLVILGVWLAIAALAAVLAWQSLRRIQRE